MAVSGDEWDGPWDLAPPWFPPPFDPDRPDVSLLESLDTVIAGLRTRSADVLRRRLGQSPEGAETLQEIGDSYEVTRERVRQIQQEALKRIRSWARRRLRRGVPRRTDEFTTRLSQALRSLPAIDRGRYLRTTFPEANVDVLARLLEACGPATGEQIGQWITEFERVRHVEDLLAHRSLKAGDRWRRFCRGAIWPAVRCTDGWFPHVPCRAVGSVGGKRPSEKLGRDVEYESGLEERLLNLFDRSPQVVEYCEQPFKIQYPWFGGPRLYVPDFAVRLADGRFLLIEAKPRSAWADGVNLAKWNAAIRWCDHRGWGFLVSDDRGHPGDLVGHADGSDYAILERLTEERPASWAALRDHWFGPGRSWSALIATALTYGFALQRSPFEVRRARRSPWLDALARETAGGPT